VCGEQRVLFYQFFSLFIVELLCIKGYHLYYCFVWQGVLVVMASFTVICSKIPIM